MARKKKKPLVGRTIPVTIDGQTFPVVAFEADAPAAGDVITFHLANGVEYTGKVESAEVIDGEAMVTFKGSIRPV